MKVDNKFEYKALKEKDGSLDKNVNKKKIMSL